MEIRYSKSAQTALFRSDKRRLIRDKIEALAQQEGLANPNVTRLKGQAEFRLRVQNWRVIFLVENETLIITHIGPRGSIYER